jgi:cytosine/adenosine deaminase-related metal-dependent hydrolase
MTIVYRARWVLPVSAAPISRGAIAIDEGRIAAVGAQADLARQFPEARVNDLGEVAILPGLVNVHSHLELTALRGFLEAEEFDFFAWLKKLTWARLERMTADDLYVSAAWGACEAARAGVTCVADASDAAGQSMNALRDVGLRGIVYQESFGPDPNLARENFALLKSKVVEHRGLETELVRVGVSPHAPYSVCAAQLEMISEFSLAEKLPLMMHVAESEAERLLLREGRGPFADGLAKRGIPWNAPGISTIQYLAQHGILRTKPLLTHCIDVDDADLETIKASGAGIAHCPKSNAKLGHGRAPLAKFVAARIPVGIGSDSVASNNLCDILEEARFAILSARADQVDKRVQLNAQEALKAATTNGARALGLEARVGALEPGLEADFVAVGLTGVHQQPAYDPYTTLIFASSGRDVVLTVVAGREVYRNGGMLTVDEARLRSRMEELSEKLNA